MHVNRKDTNNNWNSGTSAKNCQVIEAEVREQITTATKITVYLNNMVWRNRNIGIKTNFRMYKHQSNPIWYKQQKLHQKQLKPKSTGNNRDDDSSQYSWKDTARHGNKQNYKIHMQDGTSVGC